MAERKILYIINQKSGTTNNGDIQDIIQKSMDKNNIEYKVYTLSGKDDITNIKDLIRSFNPQTVVAAGGDGTINLIASIIAGMPVKMGIIPTGSANGLAFELGIPENELKAIEYIIAENAVPMDVVQINDNHISLHLSDVGINARIVKEFEKEGKRGFWGYVKHFFKELSKPQKSFRCTIQINNNLYSHKAYMTIIANASSYRTGANVNPEGRTDDGEFEIIVFKPHRKWFLKSLIGAFTGTLDKQPNIESYHCTSAVIDISPKQDLQIDGESIGKTNKIKASIYKHALNVIIQPKATVEGI